MKAVIRTLIVALTTLLIITSTWGGTFKENFADKNLDDWQEVVMLDGIPGKWEVINGELHAVSHTGLTRLLTIGDQAWRDYEIEFDVEPVVKHGPGNIGIASRVDGTNAVVCVIGDLPFLDQPKVVAFGGNLHADKMQLMASEFQRILREGRQYHFKLRVNENHFTFWVNDEKLLEFEDRISAFTSGGVGLGLTNYTARFDNFKVSGEGVPNNRGLSVSSRAKLTTSWGQIKRDKNLVR